MQKGEASMPGEGIRVQLGSRGCSHKGTPSMGCFSSSGLKRVIVWGRECSPRQVISEVQED